MPQQFNDYKERFPEPLLLLDCSRRTGVRFALRGGLIRNLVTASFDLANDGFRESLFDFVDPFSDIDILIEDYEAWARLGPVIRSAFPEADFFRWEVSLLSDVQQLAANYEIMEIDRFLLWFKYDAEKRQGAIDLEHLTGNADEIYERLASGRTQRVEFPSSWNQPSLQAALGAMFTLLKLIRYQHQLSISSEEPFSMLFIKTSARLMELRRSDWKALRAIDRFRLEMLVIDVLFNCVDLKVALGPLEGALRLLPSHIVQSSRLLRTVMSLAHELDQSNALRIGAVLYPASAELPASFGLRIEREQPPSKSLIPWTSIRTGAIRTTGTTDCCYSANGSLVISWRSVGSEKARLQGTSLQETAIQARVFSHNGYAHDSSEMIFAVPALASIQHSSTLRVDENYLRYVLGDDAEARIGLLPAETTPPQVGGSV